MDFNAQDLMEIVNNNEMLVIPQLYFDITEDLLSALILSNLAMWQKAHIQKLLSNGTEITEKNCGIYKFIEPCGDYLYREGDSFVETYKTSKHIISKALSLLKDKGLIETYKNGNLIFYSVNTSKIKEFSADFAKKSLTSQSKKNDLASEKNNFAKSKFLTSQSENFDAYTYTDKKAENQAEKTQKKSEADATHLGSRKSQKVFLSVADKPSFVSPDIWQDFCQYKKERKESYTQTGLKAFLSKLEKINAKGANVNEALLETMANDWRGVFEPKTSSTTKSKKGANTESLNASFDEWLNKYHANEQGEVIDAYCENYIQQK